MRRLPTAVGLAAVLAGTAHAAPPIDWDRAQTVTVELSSFKFSPAKLKLRPGASYRLHLVNSASKGHNFVARDFFAHSDVHPADRARLTNGGLELGGGEAVDIRVVPLQPGNYKVRCTHFMHGTLGMTGVILVG